MDISLISSKLEGFARRVGKSVARTPLLLFYILQSDETSLKDKAIIATCLAYVILPIDLIPSSKFPILGWADEILSVEIVYDRMRKYITSELMAKTEKQLEEWIPESSTKKKHSSSVLRGITYSSVTTNVDSISKKWK